jgi:hypothetical protein
MVRRNISPPSSGPKNKLSNISAWSEEVGRAWCWYLGWLTLRLWKWNRHVLPKRRLTFLRLHPENRAYKWPKSQLTFFQGGVQISTYLIEGGVERRCVVVKTLCYKPEGRWFETQWGGKIFSIYLILPAALALGFTQLLTEISSRSRKISFRGVERGRCVVRRLSRQCGLLNFWQPNRPLRSVTGIALLLNNKNIRNVF